MNCMVYVQLPLYVYGIDDSIDTQFTKKNLIFHLEALENWRKAYIGKSRKTGGKSFHNVAPKVLKNKFLCYVNTLLLEMVKTALKDTYLGGTTPTSLQMRFLHAGKIIMTERLRLY